MIRPGHELALEKWLKTLYASINSNVVWPVWLLLKQCISSRLHDANYLESGKNLLDLLFDVALGKSQESAVVVFRPARRDAFRAEGMGSEKTPDIGLGELSTCKSRIAMLNKLRYGDFLNGEKSQICFKDSENILLGGEEVMNADGLVLGCRGIAQDADHRLANRSNCRGMEGMISPVEEGSRFVLQVYEELVQCHTKCTASTYRSL